MSKERELLKRVLASSHLVTGLEKEIQELLAQPEQEPINFDLERMKLAVESPVSDVTVEGLTDKVKSNREHIVDVTDKVEPVAWMYEPEPLSDERLRDLSNSIHAHPDFDNVSVWQVFYIARAIEKAHGIGVDDDK